MTHIRLLDSLVADNDFIARHNGPDTQQQDAMLATINATSLEHVIEETVPADIRLPKPLNLNAPKSETQMLAELSDIAAQNTIKRSLIGQGYYHTHTPPPILRNVLENPGWYTAYTPYQPEISQGRLQSLLNFQQMVMDLTGMDLANASLLDEATAAAEAMTLCKRGGKHKGNAFFCCQ